jgi:hypothetical protein
MPQCIVAQERDATMHRRALARMLYAARRLPEATAVLAPLVQQHPGDVDVIGISGTIAAREGDGVAAQRSVAALRAKTGRFHYGKHLLWAARIAAVQGDADGAVTMLRGAFARGCPYGVELLADTDLRLLADDARFREIMRPKA